MNAKNETCQLLQVDVKGALPLEVELIKEGCTEEDINKIDTDKVNRFIEYLQTHYTSTVKNAQRQLAFFAQEFGLKKSEISIAAFDACYITVPVHHFLTTNRFAFSITFEFVFRHDADIYGEWILKLKAFFNNKPPILVGISCEH